MRYYDYKELHDNGMSYQEIANHFGVSRQAVYACLKHEPVAKRGRPPVYNTVFPNLSKWLKDNHTSICAVEASTGVRLAYGLRTGRVKKPVIDAVLKVTGMTYEEAFAQ